MHIPTRQTHLRKGRIHLRQGFLPKGRIHPHSTGIPSSDRGYSPLLAPQTEQTTDATGTLGSIEKHPAECCALVESPPPPAFRRNASGPSEHGSSRGRPLCGPRERGSSRAKPLDARRRARSKKPRQRPIAVAEVESRSGRMFDNGDFKLQKRKNFDNGDFKLQKRKNFDKGGFKLQKRAHQK